MIKQFINVYKNWYYEYKANKSKITTTTSKSNNFLREYTFKDYPLSKFKLEKYLKYLKENSSSEVYIMFENLVTIYQKDNNEHLRFYLNKKIWNLENQLNRKL